MNHFAAINGADVDPEEIAEFLGIAPAMGACVAEMWAVNGFHAAINGADVDPEAGCCT